MEGTKGMRQLGITMLVVGALVCAGILYDSVTDWTSFSPPRLDLERAFILLSFSVISLMGISFIRLSNKQERELEEAEKRFAGRDHDTPTQ